jgi:release factor glutamine methyltransferase
VSTEGDPGSGNADSTSDTISWRALLAEATQRFEAAEVSDAANSARRIVEEAGGFEPVEFALGLDDLVTTRGVARFDRMVSRRLVGEPLQYVVGRWSFRTLDLMVDSRVLIPRPETEVVAGVALGEIEHFEQPLVVDLGTGSGAIGLSIAVEHPSASVWLTDHSSDALAVARANLAGIGRPATRVSTAHGSWFEALPTDLRGLVAVVVSNPPYVATTDRLPSEVADWEPSDALLAGELGRDDLDRLVTEAPTWLRPDGSLVLEMAPGQTSALAELAAQRFEVVEVFDDLANRPRGIVARRPRFLPPSDDR